MSFDPIFHSSGFGAGQQAGMRAAHAAELDAARRAASAERAIEQSHNTSMALAVALRMERDKNFALQNEIQNKWIPYAMRLKANVMACIAEREYLRTVITRQDAAEADAIMHEAGSLFEAEFDRLMQAESENLEEINRVVSEEAEAGRLKSAYEIEMENQAAEVAKITDKAERIAYEESIRARLAEQQFLDSLPDEIRQLTTDERGQRLKKILNEFSMGVISQLPEWVVREQMRPELERRRKEQEARQAEIAKQEEFATQADLEKIEAERVSREKVRIAKAREQFNMGLISELPEWAK
jgi:hypothetical protein